MVKPFFPIAGKQVVPILQMEDDEGVTVVQAAKNGANREHVKLRILRLSLGSLLNATVLDVDGDNVTIERRATAKPKPSRK